MVFFEPIIGMEARALSVFGSMFRVAWCLMLDVAAGNF
jgi:hypothetical protein